MVIFYLITIILGRTLQGIFYKPASSSMPNARTYIGFTSFQFLCAGIPCFLLIIFSGGLKIDLLTLGLATSLGLCMLLGGFCSLFAMKSGTVSLSSMFSSAGLIVPLIAGIILFGQPIRLLQWFGVGLFFVSSYFLIGSSKKIYTNFSFKTIFLLIGSLLFSGGSALSQQLFTYYVPDGDITVFTFLSFIVTSALGAIVCLFTKNKEQNISLDKRSFKALTVCGIALGVAIFLINLSATALTKLISPVILFTFANGSFTIISTLFGAVLYKEKITLQSVIGIILGIASLVIIKLF
ncbi:MAG: DMT family transporter [Clostridia bacterium]|nr:DMT family transporter [Clostridia bacterium]